MYAVEDTHSDMSPVGDGGGEEELCHVRSGGCSVTHVPSGGWEERGVMYAVGDSLTCPQWWMGEEKRSSACMQWGTLSDTCPWWGMVEERRICAMYAVGDAQ